MVRPLYETYLRAYWALHCAILEEIETFKLDKFDTSIGRLVKAVETQMGNSGGVFTRIKDKFWGGMSSYVHGGFLQAVRRIGANEIAGDLYSEEEREEAVTFTHAWALAAAHEVFLLLDDKLLAEESLRRAMALK